MTNDPYPDPSSLVSDDFYSSAFRIKRLLRRRGYKEVVPMGGNFYSFMPIEIYKKWSSFQGRKKLIATPNGGKEFERFVAQIISREFCNPSTFSNIVLDLSPGGDYDVLAEGPGESLFYFETKTSVEGTEKSVGVPEMWNFMVRESRLGADMSVFLYDVNFQLDKLMVPIFEILYSLAEYLNPKLEGPQKVVIENWIKEIKGSTLKSLKFHSKISKKEVYYLYCPVLIIAGGDDLMSNIGRALSLYFTQVKHISPFPEFWKRRSRSVFMDLPNWNDLPKEVGIEMLRKKIPLWVEEKSVNK